MRSFMLKVRVGTLLLIIGTSSFLAGAAHADVFPQSPFTFSGFGGVYQGTCTTLFVNGSFVNSCHAELVSGTPVSHLTNISSGDLHGVVAPSGEVIEVVRQ